MSDQYGQQGPGGWQPQPEQDGRQPQQGGWQPEQGGWQPQQPPPGQQGFGGWQQGQDQQAGFQQQSPGGWQPQQGAQGWQPQPGQQGPGGWQPQPPKKRNLGVLITAAVVVLALAAGLTIWLVSKKDSNSVAQGGKATPQAAAAEMMNSLAQKDAVGVVEQLDPTEAELFADVTGGILDQLKRLEIVTPDADANALVSGAITLADLKFEEGDGEKVSDNVTIVKLIGGTITVNENALTPPFTDKIKAATGGALDDDAPRPQTYDIAEEIAKNDGEAIRIATVLRGDSWYPSLFYTVADNWYQQALKENPALADEALQAPIAAIGGGSPEEAVRGLIDRAMQGDAEGVIGMLPPDEMGVLYDYGKRMLATAGEPGPLGQDIPNISNLEFNTAEVDGGVKVSLKSVTVEVSGQQVSVTLDPDAGTISVTANGQSQVVNIEQAFAQGFGGMEGMPPGIADMVKRIAKQAMTIGFVTTEVDGQWYVSPLRSFTGVFTTLLEALEPADIDMLLQLADR